MPLFFRIIFWVIIIPAILIPSVMVAQDMPLKKDKEAPKPHSITKAAIYSAVLPGLGQAYNRKYWKIPVIYAGFGVFGYFTVKNNQEFNMFKEAYLWVANGKTDTIDNPYAYKYNQTQLKEAMDYYRRNRDLSIILAGLWYTLNILEAFVDAHFFNYDISEDLGMRISPAAVRFPLSPVQAAPGVKVSFKF